MTMTVGDETPTALTAWPNPSSALTNVGVVSSAHHGEPLFTPGARVTISALKLPYLAAKELQVKLR